MTEDVRLEASGLATVYERTQRNKIEIEMRMRCLELAFTKHRIEFAYAEAEKMANYVLRGVKP